MVHEILCKKFQTWIIQTVDESVISVIYVLSRKMFNVKNETWFACKMITILQVLNLNLSNLLLFLVLKAVVFGASYLGNHGYVNKGRELEEGN